MMCLGLEEITNNSSLIQNNVKENSVRSELMAY